jgi:hypothetical protein
VLKKTAVTGGLLIAAAAGALVTTCSPAFAAAPSHLVSDHTRNWNGSENENLNHIRLHIRNRNNNIAVARTPQRERRHDWRGNDMIGAPVTTPPVVG